MDIEGNPLVEGKQYIIGLKNNSKRYIGKYVRQDEDRYEDVLIFNMVYELNKNSPPIPFSRGEYSFFLDNVRLATPEYFKNLKQSVLGKNKRQEEQEEEEEQVQEEKRFKEEDNQYTAEEIEEDKKFWESVDGGSRRKSRRSKSKRRKSKSKRRTKRRKYNK